MTRHEIAIAAMQGLLANSHYYKRTWLRCETDAARANPHNTDPLKIQRQADQMARERIAGEAVIMADHLLGILA